jgi:ubiquinone/menaquinone biosynthesis C-methylase UbiE
LPEIESAMNDFDAKARDWDNQPDRVERAKAVAAAIRRQVPLSTQMTALEYGCGTGLLSFFLQPYLGRITLADSSDGMLAVLAGKIAAAGANNMTPLKLDLVADPLPAGRYALIYTLMTLHHIRESDKLLAAFNALLEPPGVLCIVDLEKEDGTFHDPGFEGHTGFDRAALTGQLLQAGFTGVRFFPCYEVPRKGRQYPLFLALAEKPEAG